MGSLMAGWDSPVSDPVSAIRKRNRSLTKEEIEAYWRSKKKIEEEHLKAISSPDSSSEEIQTFGDYERKFMKSHSMPNRKPDFLGMDTETVLQDIIKNNGWWTRSSWAFLNEPPVLDRPTSSYKPQFHVATLAVSQPNEDAGISAN